MGNCQAAEAATVVIQHPGGKIERLYWPTTAEEVMKSNPGHHVTLVTLYVSAQQQQQQQNDSKDGGHLRFTRVRLLKPKDILLIGQVYRLITSQEVSKALKARKLEKTKKTQQSEFAKKQRQQQQQQQQGLVEEAQRAEQQQQKAGARTRERQWRPRLQSISEGVS